MASRPPLPAPTDFSSTDNASALGPTYSDVATDITTRTDKTHYTIPDDGSPVTISTKGRRADTKESQTSLLIEYFEGSKTGDKVRSRPSVRVRVTPSSSRKSKGTHDHIQITETGKNRKPSYTRRISLPSGGSNEGISSRSDESLRRPPVEVEVMHNGSDLSNSDLAPTRFVHLPSEVSSIPPDSLLDASNETRVGTKGTTDRSISTFEQVDNEPNDLLAAPTIKRSRSASRERIAQKAAEKIRREQASASRTRSKATGDRSRSVSREQIYEIAEPPRKRSGSYQEDDRSISTLQPSEISALSHTSERSHRSGTSGASINNPKLLNAVEDAIKRLILPELTAVKEKQKTLENRSKFEDSVSSSRLSNGSREGTRRTSLRESSSLPNVNRPTVVADDRGQIIESDSVDVRKTRRRSSRGSGSERSASGTIREGSSHSRRRSSKEKSHLAEVAAAAAGTAALAGLTAANLKHHDSASSVEGTRERRKRRSKSRSRSRSIHEHYDRYSDEQSSIPPLPMQSNLTSDLTRDSILSAETERPRSMESIKTKTPVKEVREVSRGSPRHVLSPGPTTPVRSPLSLRNDTHESERSSRSVGSPKSGRSSRHRNEAAIAGVSAGLAGAALAHEYHEHHESEDFDHNRLTPHRDVSPVQSIGSYQHSADVLEHSRVRSIKSDASLGSPKRSRRAYSPEVLASAGSPPMYKYKNIDQPQSTAGAYEILPEDEYNVESPYQSDIEDDLEREHEENEHYREQYRSELGISEPSEIGTNNRTSYAQESAAEQYSDEEDQHIHQVNANPEYVHTPLAVESAVASLHDPSMISGLSGEHTPNKGMQHGVLAGRGMPVQPLDATGPTSKDRFSMIRDQELNSAAKYKQGGFIEGSPHLESMRSFDSQPKMGASALPIAGDDMPEIGMGVGDDESDFISNPSIINGQLEPHHQEDRSHWPYDQTPSPTHEHERNPLGHDAALLGGAAAAAGAIGLGVAHHQLNESDLTQQSAEHSAGDLPPSLAKEVTQTQHDGVHAKDVPQEYYGNVVSRPFDTTPNYLKDEGYVTQHDIGNSSPAINYGDVDDQDLDDYAVDMDGEDPFATQKHLRHMSGMSHGMGSPLYDAATGKGMDRIESKDVVALMDHLTVRDAQRNARDTEILVTLVRTAAEMRNGFEEMKRFIAEQDVMIKQNTDRNAEMTVNKILGGPRPLPGKSSPRTARSQASDESETRTKKANVLRRWMKGINSKNSNELTKIEDMLMHLLDEVESLKRTQQIGAGMTSSGIRSKASLNSYEQLRANADSGYEPEGRASTAERSNNQSGHLSASSQRQLNGIMHSGYERHASDGNRISTVHEDDEDYEDVDPQNQRSSPYQTAEEEQDRMPTPKQDRRRSDEKNSFDTPRDRALRRLNGQNGPDEVTPNTSKSRKSIFSHIPKISRWSKTTASSAPDNNAPASGYRRNRPSMESSRTGSSRSIDQGYDDDYELHEDDRLRSRTSLQAKHNRSGSEPPRSPSPLIPEEGSELQDDPKYHAHRNSLNLQHPQPRQGPTHRHQNHLEKQAISFEHPSTPDADLFGNTPSLANNRNRFSNGSNLAPAAAARPQTYSPAQSDGAYSDGAYSRHSASEEAHNTFNSPSRSSRQYDDGPLVPASTSTTQARAKPAAVNTSDKSPTSAFPYGSPMLNTAIHIPSPLEPIAEVRYSLETDRGNGNSSRGLMTPSPQPMQQQSQYGRSPGARSMASRKVTPAGPRDMPAGSIKRKPVGGTSPAGAAQTEAGRAGQGSQGGRYASMSPVSLQSYHGSTESETF